MSRLFLLAILQSALLCGGQIFLKFALQKMLPFGWNVAFWKSVLTNWQFAACGIFFVACSLLWMYMIKHFPLSQAYPMVSMSYVFGLLSAMIFFHEHVDAMKWIGVVMIMGGCFLITTTASAQKLDHLSTTSLQCDFVQTKKSEMLSQKVMSQGKMYFVAPNKLRWEYNSPENILFVVNGDKILYKKNGHQDVNDVSRKKVFKKISQMMLLFVTGDFLKENKLFRTTIDGEKVTLIPLKGDIRHAFSKVVLHIDRQRGVVTIVEMYEKRGDITLIEMKNIQKDGTIKQSLFNTGTN